MEKQKEQHYIGEMFEMIHLSTSVGTYTAVQFILSSICEPCLEMEMSADPTYLYFLSPAPAPMLT